MGWSGMSEGLGEGGGQVIMWGEQSSPFGWNTYLGLTDMGGGTLLKSIWPHLWYSFRPLFFTQHFFYFLNSGYKLSVLEYSFHMYSLYIYVCVLLNI